MSSSEGVNQATITKDSQDRNTFQRQDQMLKKCLPIRWYLYLTTIPSSLNRYRMEWINLRQNLAYRVPASKITKKNMYEVEEEELEGLDTTIDWKNTGDNSYDGEKLQLLLHDESGKWDKPDNILNNWRVTKTCLKFGK